VDLLLAAWCARGYDNEMEDGSDLEHGRLSEAKTKAAFAARSWPALKSHLDDIGVDDATLDELLGHLRRASGLIFRYPDVKREPQRDAFLENLQDYIYTAHGEEGADRAGKEIGLLYQIQRGYRGILATLSAADISKLPPASRVAACLDWSIRAYADVMKLQDDAARNLKQILIPNAPSLIDDDGRPVSVDALINAIVCSLSTTLVMEAYKNDWRDSADTVTLPELPEVNGDAVSKAGANAALAMCWSRWQRTEERRRFLGGELDERAAPNLPGWAPTDAILATEYTPDEAEFFDYAANERLLDKLGQQFMQMTVETNVKTKVAGIASPVPLAPAGIVSIEEAHAAASLGEILKYEISDDMDRPGDLRLVEWLRGYAVLKELASDAQQSRPGGDGLALTLERAELLSVLERCGLTAPCAALFVDLATLKVTSKDLFDSPLVQMHDGRLMVFGPALLTSNLTIVLLSRLATLQEPLSRKGLALEDTIVSLFRAQNLHARGFEVTRSGEQYEYDAVLTWGDYVFVFECKNHNLSNNRPVNAYHFDLGIRSAARQVKRLADALQKFPDILADQMQIDIATKIVVPCVLNSLPYARTGELDGVYCTDSSVLDRFFSERYFFLKMPIPIREKLTVLHRVAFASLWKADKPSPEDLLEQLKAPLQLKLLKGHTQLQRGVFPIAPMHSVASIEYVRIAWTVESVATVFGLSAVAIQKTMDDVRQQMQNLKKTDRTRKQKKQRRARKGK
jgi:hypothetical protein